MGEDILGILGTEDILSGAKSGGEFSATPLGGGRSRFDIFAEEITLPEMKPEPRIAPQSQPPVGPEARPDPEIKEERPPAAATAVTKVEPIQKTEPAPIKAEIQPTLAKDNLPAYVQEVKEIKMGDVCKGRIVKMEKNGVFVDIGYKSEGFIGLDELILHPGEEVAKIYPIGREVDVLVMKLESKDGQVELSQKKAAYEVSWKVAYQAFMDRSILEAYVVSGVRGGLVVDYDGLRGFIPASQIARQMEVPMEGLVGQKIPIKVIEIDRRKKKVVFSHRLAADESRKQQSRKILEELEVGQVRKGKVSSIKDFGVFVDLGGVEGLVHVSEMAWARPNHPSEMVTLGQDLDVFVLGVDQETGKIALGMKQLEADPWVEAKNMFKVGQTVEGTVSRLVKFGAFVTLGNGLEGLVHLTELTDPAPVKPEDVIKSGQKIKVKILRVIPEEQKIGLSLKAAKKDEEAAARKAETVSYTTESVPRVTIGDLMKEKGLMDGLTPG